jgi:hypothetical protein
MDNNELIEWARKRMREERRMASMIDPGDRLEPAARETKRHRLDEAERYEHVAARLEMTMWRDAQR